MEFRDHPHQLDDVPQGEELDVHIQRSDCAHKLEMIVERYHTEGKEAKVMSLSEGLINDWNDKSPAACCAA